MDKEELDLLQNDVLANAKQFSTNLPSAMPVLAAPSTPSITVPTVAPKEPKVSDPDFFHGDRRKTRTFLMQLHLIFAVQPLRYSTDAAKVAKAMSHLRGPAAGWAAPIIEKGSPLCHDYKAFSAALLTAFGDADRTEEAIRSLERLQQTGSASAYSTEFNRLSQETGFNQPPLIKQYLRGLKDPLRQALAAHSPFPSSLSDLISLAVDIDERMRDFELDRRTRRPGHTPGHLEKVFINNTNNLRRNSRPTPHFHHLPNNAPSRPINPSSRPVDPMQVDTQRRGPLTDAEKRRRKELNLCLYCGSSQHQLSSCPLANRSSGGQSRQHSARVQPRQQTPQSGNVPPARPNLTTGN